MSSPDRPPSEQSIQRFQALLQERLGIVVSPIEVRDILWLAAQRAEVSPAKDSEPVDERDAVEVEIRVNDSAPPEIDVSSPPERTADVVLPDQAGTRQQNAASVPLKVPDAAVLRGRRELIRSLRPLMRKVPSKRRFRVDEAATAARIAEKQIWEVVRRPEPERWLELAIVVEVTAVYGVWQQPIQQFCVDLQASGIFRDVRVWQIRSDVDGVPQLYRQRSRGGVGPMAPAKELLNPASERVILVVSDCTSRAWRSGQVPELLQGWMREHLVSIVQLLPPVYWERSALKYGTSVALQAKRAAAVNQDWRMVGLSALRRQRLSESMPERLQLPVVTVEPQSLGLWARALVAQVGAATVGQILDLEGLAAAFQQKQAQSQDRRAVLSAQARVERFERTATMEALELAEILALVPLDWAVIRLVQKNLLGQTAALFLAEMVLSGLLVSVGEEYEFRAGVRSALLGTIDEDYAVQLADEVAEEIIYELLPPAAQRRMEEIVASLSRDLIDRREDAPRYFEALVVAGKDETFAGEMQTTLLKFAAVGEEVLRSWGGEYVAVAEQLAGYVPPPVKWPEIVPFEFETVQLVRDKMARVFEFETAQVEIQRQGLLWRKKAVITKSQGRATGYGEPLADGIELEMVQIPGGTFVMGSHKDEKARSSVEGPQIDVSISSFAMGRYAVTQAQWRVVAGWESVSRDLAADPSRFKGPNRPVERVSWLDAEEFCARLSQRTGRAYRLPSEAEWEYACRAGTTTPFYFGETITTDLANYKGNYTYGNGPKGKYREETIEVGSFPANGYGLHEMQGNVWEWCINHWHGSYEGLPKDGRLWIDRTAKTATERALRGGSWLSPPRDCRSAQRDYVAAYAAGSYIGFRVVSMPQDSI